MTSCKFERKVKGEGEREMKSELWQKQNNHTLVPAGNQNWLTCLQFFADGSRFDFWLECCHHNERTSWLLLHTKLTSYRLVFHNMVGRFSELLSED